jgi:hypothetical protein
MPSGGGKSLTFRPPPSSAQLHGCDFISHCAFAGPSRKGETPRFERQRSIPLTTTEERESREALAEGKRRLIYAIPVRLQDAEYRRLLREAGRQSGHCDSCRAQAETGLLFHKPQRVLKTQGLCSLFPRGRSQSYARPFPWGRSCPARAFRPRDCRRNFGARTGWLNSKTRSKKESSPQLSSRSLLR